jgi:hypothetical protein
MRVLNDFLPVEIGNGDDRLDICSFFFGFRRDFVIS